MDLRNFIKESLVQIALGIEDADDALEDSSAFVNPINVHSSNGKHGDDIYGFISKENSSFSVSRVIQNIRFDVAVTAEKGTESKGGVGLMVGALAFGSQGKSDASNASQSRIQFSIPMLLPAKRKA
jgi:hypothetical protein